MFRVVALVALLALSHVGAGLSRPVRGPAEAGPHVSGGTPQVAQAPILSLAYAGDASGVPHAEDLADLPLLGFSAVTWPESAPAEQTARLNALARAAGLAVIVRAAAPIDVEIEVGREPHAALWPRIWRAVAHGARALTIVPAPDLRARDLATRNPVWLPVVSAAARQLRVNAALFARAAPGPPVRIAPAVRDLDVALLDAGRTWLLVATNSSDRRVRATAQLPAQVPYAMWLELLDGSTMAMLEQPDGPKWIFDLDARGVRIYVIDKILR